MHHQRSAWVASTTATIVHPSTGRKGRSKNHTSATHPISNATCSNTMAG